MYKRYTYTYTDHRGRQGWFHSIFTPSDLRKRFPQWGHLVRLDKDWKEPPKPDTVAGLRGLGVVARQHKADEKQAAILKEHRALEKQNGPRWQTLTKINRADDIWKSLKKKGIPTLSKDRIARIISD